jgi:inosose dehydratase
VRTRIANAPVSFGVFGIADADREPPRPERVLAELAALGYRGIDLGPPGWLGDAAHLRDNLDAAGLDVAGGWVDLPFHDDRGYRDRVPELDRALDLFVAGRGDDPAWWPRPTLAVTETPERRALPTHGAARPHIGLDDEGWRTLAVNVADASQRCRERGLEPTFHHHISSHVESPAEIDRLLDSTDIGLTLDTGHLLMAGGDPVDAFRRWGERINHLHVKDVHLTEVAEAVRSGADLDALWRCNPFCAVGSGDLDLDGTVAAIRALDLTGWVVVEQDIVPRPTDTFDAILADQALSIERLHAAGLPGPLTRARESHMRDARSPRT